MKITTLQQFENLVSEMKKNPAYAKGFRKGIKPLNFETFWKDISEKFNPLGPPVRDGDGWHKVWKDFKFKVKKKLVNNKSEARATGGGVNKQVPLSPLEEAVANLLEFEKQIDPSGNVLGFNETEIEVEACAVEELEIQISTLENANINDGLPTVSTRVRTSKNSKCAENERIKLLRTQPEVQQERCSQSKSIKGYLPEKETANRRRTVANICIKAK